ncbi:hypothetical protein [Acinetobacter portensis]|uniref:hypothetical protein n=1 Tax=Acinetobacter portensis TaxID=1839785 RepID=UPI0013D5A1EC|nr:hypothetical protein [Acinetobacter portensis]
MSQKVILFDLEDNPPTASLLRKIIEHYATIYVFNCSGKFEFPLGDLTEFSSWVNSGQVVVLDTPQASQREFEYAVVVGQLLALLDADSHVEVISATDSSDMLILMLQSSNISCHLIQVELENKDVKSAKYVIPSIQSIIESPDLKLVKQYCDALEKMSGKPNNIEKLKNSILNVLNVEAEKAQHLIGMLINLKIVKKFDEQISFRKKVLKQWALLDLDNIDEQQNSTQSTSNFMAHINTEKQASDLTSDANANIQNAQNGLFKNFAMIDPVQLEFARKLRELKSNKPKDIYELRDLLEQLFPQSNIRLLLKELLDKGYIYWNGHEVLYSHEMFLN